VPSLHLGHILKHFEEALLPEHLRHLSLEDLAPHSGDVVDLFSDLIDNLDSNGEGQA